MRSPGKSACISAVLAILGIAGLAACPFHPPEAKPDGAPGDDGAPRDAEPPDAMPDAALCYGSGIGRVCLTSPPVEPRRLDGTIDTGDDAACTEVLEVAGATACVIAGTTIDVPSGAHVRGIGARPLVLVASGLMQIEGELTVGSTRGGDAGAGAASGAACPGQVAPQNDVGGAGGGAGGSFAGEGGDGEQR